jgi:hypothetical protein
MLEQSVLSSLKIDLFLSLALLARRLQIRIPQLICPYFPTPIDEAWAVSVTTPSEDTSTCQGGELVARSFDHVCV